MELIRSKDLGSNYTQHEKFVVDKYNVFIEDEVQNRNSSMFMNDGYVDLTETNYPIEDPELKDLVSLDKYKNFKHQIQLYKKLIDVAKLGDLTEGKTLLELSCGKGGGLSFYKDYYNFSRLIGLDLNPNQIQICKENSPDIEFVTGSATKVPLENEIADVVLTLEAYTYYEPRSSYAAEAARLLKPGGLLIQCCPTSAKDDLYTKVLLEGYGLTLVAEEDLIDNVRMACLITVAQAFHFSPITSLVHWNDVQKFLSAGVIYNCAIFQKEGLQ